ncbi:MAG: GNAT family N-acetyltransferase [Luteitalea sp.]|nr:GNAT family N-acetyltransferase [Luteitalea sp.]
MPTYRVRPATLGDADALVHHRIAMFTDMGVALDAATLDHAFRSWLGRVMPEGIYRGWLAETDTGDIVAGGAITIIPWPPGPRYLGDRAGFVYNVYTEPAHRGRGLARRLMTAIHDWCRVEGVSSLALNASHAGEPLYASMGYTVATSPMMFLALS